MRAWGTPPRGWIAFAAVLVLMTSGWLVASVLGHDPAPTVVGQFPVAGADDVPAGARVDVLFDRSLGHAADRLSLVLRGPGGEELHGAVHLSQDLRAAELQPAEPLTPGPYTASVAVPGLMTPHEWSFRVPRRAPVTEGPGGPVLLATSSGERFDAFYAEMLRAEGITGFGTVDVSDLTAADLAGHEVAVVAGDPGVEAVGQLRAWVAGGGHLVLVDPTGELASVAGLRDPVGRVPAVREGWLRIEGATARRGRPGVPLRLHAPARAVSVADGVEVVATVSRGGRSLPAVTLRRGAGDGGHVAALTFDLARSVVLTRQGNPRWAGQERDGHPPIRSDDLFWSDPADQPHGDEEWLDLDTVEVPHADEQMRLLTGLLVELTRDTSPMPRFWYFPHDEEAVLVMAADDHATESGTRDSFERMRGNDDPGCRVERWECARATSWVYPDGGLTAEEAGDFVGDGFDVGVHPTTSCQNWSRTSLEMAFARSLRAFRAAYPDLPPQTGSRLHCIAWSEQVTQPRVERRWGIRFDMNYYYWPGDWVDSREGFMTGSGLPMRFSDLDGGLIDVYQQETHLVDEVFEGDPDALRDLVARARGPQGYVGAFGTHYDFSNDFDVELMDAARELDVPMVSARQMLDWMDGRAASRVTRLRWSGDEMTFRVRVDERAEGLLRMMVPVSALGGRLEGVSRDGEPVATRMRVVKGVEYAFVDAADGSYRVRYAP